MLNSFASMPVIKHKKACSQLDTLSQSMMKSTNAKERLAQVQPSAEVRNSLKSNFGLSTC